MGVFSNHATSKRIDVAALLQRFVRHETACTSQDRHIIFYLNKIYISLSFFSVKLRAPCSMTLFVTQDFWIITYLIKNSSNKNLHFFQQMLRSIPHESKFHTARAVPNIQFHTNAVLIFKWHKYSYFKICTTQKLRNLYTMGQSL